MFKKNYLLQSISTSNQASSLFYTQVLQCLFDTTLKLATSSLSFRGHRESIADVYSGNFVKDIKHQAKYNPIMKRLLELPKGSVKYMSSKIQNQLISCLSNHVKNILFNDLNSAAFYSIISDSTQDITIKDQLSRVFRYVKIKRVDG